MSLRFARWAPPPGRKGTVCLFQGRAEFIEKYFETVRDLRARGFAVATLDWRGQGLRERALRNPRKGYVRNFAEYDIDLATFMQRGRAAGLSAAGVRAGAFDGRDACSCAPRMRGHRWFDRMVLLAPHDRACRACAVRPRRRIAVAARCG